MIIIRNCRLVPELTEGYNDDIGDVLIDGDKIIAIDSSIDIENESLEIIEANERTLLPGFMDLHVHLGYSAGEIHDDNLKAMPYRALESLRFANDSLKSGFTFIRDMGAPDSIVLNLRDAINNGYFNGPTIHACGKIITPTEAGNDFFTNLYSESDGLDEVTKAVRIEIKRGADFIKYLGTGAVMNPGGNPGASIYNFEEVQAIVEATKVRGLYVAGHNHGSEGIKDAIKAGVRTIEHGIFINKECLELLEKSESYLIPTLTVTRELSESAEGTSAFMKDKCNKILNQLTQNLDRAYLFGLKLGFGSDMGMSYCYHGNNLSECNYRYEMIGMKPIDILKQMTINNAEIIGVNNQLGTVKKGKNADLVLINGKPHENIYDIHNEKIVIKSGRVVHYGLKRNTGL